MIFAIIIVSLILVQSIKAENIFKVDLQNNSVNEKVFDLKMNLLRRFCDSPSLNACIIKNNKTVWAKSYGYSDVYKSKKATIDDIYLVGSVTKTITATALLQLYEKGYCNLDDDVSTYLPFNLKNPKFPDVNITLRMLLSHRSSIFDYCIFSPIGMFETLIKSDIFNDLESFLKDNLLPEGKFYNPKYWTDYEPGMKADYSNVGFFIIGYIIERISGMSIEDYCQENIFCPLNMFNTSYHPQYLDKEKMTVPYIKKAGIYVPIPHYDAKDLAAMGGLRTNLEDLSHFLIAHMNDGVYEDVVLLQKETVELMHNCIYDNEEGALLEKDYGLGWFECNQYGTIVAGHGGMCPGSVCFMLMNESSDTGFIFFMNKFNILQFFQLLKCEIVAKCRDIIGKLLLEKATQFDNEEFY